MLVTISPYYYANELFIKSCEKMGYPAFQLHVYFTTNEAPHYTVFFKLDEICEALGIESSSIDSYIEDEDRMQCGNQAMVNRFAFEEIVDQNTDSHSDFADLFYEFSNKLGRPPLALILAYNERVIYHAGLLLRLRRLRQIANSINPRKYAW